MNKHSMVSLLKKRFFVFSLLLHFFIIFLFWNIASRNYLNKKFVVFGAYSSLESIIYFKPLSIKTVDTDCKKELKQDSKIKNVQPNEEIKKTEPAKEKEQNQTNVASSISTNPKKQKKELINKSDSNALKKNKNKKEDLKKIDTENKKNNDKKDLRINEPESKKIEKNENQSIPSKSYNNRTFREFRDSVVESVKFSISRLWKPPLNVPKGTFCKITISINKLGKINNVSIVSPSKIPIFDMSVQSINWDEVQLPVEVWNKNISVEMYQ